LLDVFPPDQQEQIRAMVSESLRGIISQQLVPRADGSGRVLALETLTNTPAVANVYMFSSTDHGQHWSKPNLIGSTNAAHMLPAAVAGRQGGQLAIGYFQTTNGKTDPNDLGGQWTYTTAESANSASASPTFTYADVNPGFIYHHGQICNEGILCGAPGQPSDRSLLDFTSATVDSAGCPLYTFAANPTGTPTTNDNTAGSPTLNTFNYVTRQLTGCFQPATATTASGGGAATASTPGAAVFGSPFGRRRTGGAHGHTVACVASKRLLFHINPVPGGFVIKAAAYVNGHKVAQRRGRHLETIAFRRPRGSRLNVKIVTTNNKGGRVITTRSFIGCRTKTRVNGRTHRHKVRHKKKHK